MQSIKYNTAMENSLKGLFVNFKTSYSDTVVLKRSILYAISMGSHLQVGIKIIELLNCFNIGNYILIY